MGGMKIFGVYHEAAPRELLQNLVRVQYQYTLWTVMDRIRADSSVTSWLEHEGTEALRAEVSSSSTRVSIGIIWYT